MDTSRYHEPVMGPEVVEALSTVEAGWIVDATVGGGGHSALLLEARKDVQILALDRDPEAIDEADRKLKAFSDRVRIAHASFDCIEQEVAVAEIESVSGCFYDLGVSSHQIDEGKRGFSYDNDGPLDMRMGPDAATTAEAVVNGYDEQSLAHLLREYGEERNARRIARAICVARKEAAIRTTGQLADIVGRLSPSPHEVKSKARVFQALRIEVNGELDQLRHSLDAATDLLSPGGRIAVLTYHSLEDRIVKQTMRGTRDSSVPPDLPVETTPVRLREVNPRGTVPSAEGLRRNPRARSARLRIAARV